MTAGPLPRIRTAEDFVAAFGVSRETASRFETYAALLRRWQKAVNLVAPDTLDDLWHRHFADSAQLLDLAPEARIWLDLGSGAGFPGLPIALLLANHNGAIVHLVESNARKCAFLAEVARETGAPVDIHNVRIETLHAGGTLPAPDVVVARALAPLGRLVAHALPMFGPHTRALLPKGRQAAKELATALRTWSMEARLIPSRTEAGAGIVEVRSPALRDSSDATA